MMKADYVMQMDEKSFCKYCGKSVELLCPDVAKFTPIRDKWFYICFDCRKVFQIGRGEVQRV
jgi:uncharacterized protein with PIN domain